jgi:16S rRNA (adenine1518-N6/adenine1519-N6)-dimethyltransferase
VTRLGQHFLRDPNLLDKIVAALDPAPDDVVLEIGAGKGALTRVLAPRVQRVVAIEKDRRLAAELEGGGKREEGREGSVRVVQGDALALDWHELVSRAAAVPLPLPSSLFPAFKVIGNIPYYITSPLIDKALTPPLPERVVFLVQREVAERLAARPGGKQYGALSVGVQAVCCVEKLFVVKAGAFRPAPRVDSAVVRLTPRPDPVVRPDEMAAFRTFVTASFSRRRKQLANALVAATGRPVAAVRALLARLGFAATRRPESLSPEEFAVLLRASRQL